MASKQFHDEQITSINPNIEVRNMPGKSLILINSTIKKGKMTVPGPAVLQFDYELHSTPNQMAVHRYNHVSDTVKAARGIEKAQADVDCLPSDANSFSFKVNNTIILSEKFKENVSKIVSSKVIPAISQSVLGFDFVQPVDEFYLYQVGKLPVARNFYWMKECLQHSGFTFSEDKVQAGGKKFVDGFKIKMPQ